MRLYLLICSFVIITSILCSKSISKYNIQDLKDTYKEDTNRVKLIDKNKLLRLCKSNNSKLTWVAIYTNHCSGTQYLLQDINNAILKYGNKFQILLCSSVPYAEVPEMLKVLNKYKVFVSPVYIIDSNFHKDDIEDNRVKGYDFRNDICKPCRSEIIGVPYSILFNKRGIIVYHGYNMNNEIDSILNVYLK
ncbi:MAG: hypothetical protein IPI46_12235 [Bacteroidetes bacterium]|nr:hypothetical protein [Bacteroidota bacterium]